MIDSIRIRAFAKKQAVRFPVAAFMAFLTGLALLHGHPPGPRSGDIKQAMIEKAFSNIELYKQLSRYDEIGYTLAEIIQIAKEGISSGGSMTEYFKNELQRAEKDMLDLQRLVPGKINDLIRQLKTIDTILPKVDDQKIRNMEKWIEDLSRIPDDKLAYTSLISRDLSSFISSCSSTILRIPEEQMPGHLRAADDLKTAVDFACVATEQAKADQSMQEANRNFRRIESLEKPAEEWRELRNRKTEDGGVDWATPDRLRKDLKKAEDRISDLKALVDTLSREASALQNDLNIADNLNRDQDLILDKYRKLINAYKETLKVHPVGNSPVSQWYQLGSLLALPPDETIRQIQPVLSEFKDLKIEDAA
jgi:hypothetical protein